MRVAFIYVAEDMVEKIITSFIRPTLEHAAVGWNPHLKKKCKKKNRKRYKEQPRDGYKS